MEIDIREQSLPGIGRQYEMALDAERTLSVVVDRGGVRHIAVRRVTADEPAFAARLDHDQAVVLATVLLGAKFTVGTAADDGIGADEVVIETVTLDSASPAVGRLVEDIPMPADRDAAVLAVISHATPALLEDHSRRRCEPGDRIVIAARRRHLAAVLHRVAG